MDTRFFLTKTMLEKQEAVRDYQRFADSTSIAEIKEAFKSFAETEALQSAKIKELLDKYTFADDSSE
ncbi:MAG: hypothetical protein GX058_04270 [Firmicutes bacterium]|nr:hypothetical protein [Bacillota bacterium]